ncbi:MAG: bestrophin family ion channel [Candidatus Neomarinimicrobiota bacterium]|jgi:predicted membrane chloride channel (bestrophin family)|nr:bestrophin family ion channel [Candidatus Neomarinimicrobiota bacterium]
MKYFLDVVNIKSVIVIVAACVATVICKELNFFFDVPPELIGIAIVFPIVFSINAAYSRREKALSHYANLKAFAFSIRLAHKHWAPENDNSHIERIDKLYSTLFSNIHEYLRSNNPKIGTYNHIINIFGKIYFSIDEIRSNKNHRYHSEYKINDQHCNMVAEFENIINIKNYRTPNSLRAYTKVFLNFFPVIFGPFFAAVAIEHGMTFGIILAVIYGLVLTSLDNIQEDLEDPFDGIGSDDISLNFPSMLEPSLLGNE